MKVAFAVVQIKDVRLAPLDQHHSAVFGHQCREAILRRHDDLAIHLPCFGLNARRPDGFTGGGIASGRVNYDEHANVASRHVNAPVALMQAAMSGSPTPNGTGGSAAMSADCTPPAECPSGFNSVIVYVEDNAGRVLYDVNGHRLEMPASNRKLFSAAAR